MKNTTLLISILIIAFSLNAQSSSLKFNGTDNYVKYSETNTLLETHDNFTIEMWVKSESNAPGCIYAEGSAGSNSNQFRIWGSGGKLVVRPINSSSPQVVCTDANGNNLFAPGKPWYHIAVVGKPSTNSGDIDLEVYVDGQVRGSLTYTKPVTDYDNSLIGKYSGSGGTFDGEIDEFRAWSRSLSESELNANKCNLSNTTGLVRHVRFNEASGGTVYDEVSGISETIQGAAPTWTTNTNCSMMNLTAYYPFNGNADDESANDNDGTVFEASLTTDRFGNSNSAYAFDGSNDYIEIEDNDVFSLTTTSQLSVSVWMRIDALNFENYEGTGDYVHWMGKGINGQKEWLFRMYNQSSSIRPNRTSCYAFNLSGGLGAGSYVEESLTVGEWIHYVMVYDYTTNTIRLYKNGVLRDTDNFSDYTIVPQNGTAPVRIGTSDFNSYFKGAIDDIRFYDGILNAEQIEYLYNESSATLSNDDTYDYNLSELYLYPNPTNSDLFINNPKRLNLSFKLYDTFGRIIKQGKNESIIETSNLSPGMYIISLKDNSNNKYLMSQKIIKN